MKNTVMTDKDRYIHVLGLTTMGSMHDYALLKEEWDTLQHFFEKVVIYADTAYIALLKDYGAEYAFVPFKKKRKKKGEPKDELTEKQKTFNTQLSKIRVRVEHAIGKMKIPHCLKNVWRGRRLNFDDQVALLGAGLWNAHLRLNLVNS